MKTSLTYLLLLAGVFSLFTFPCLGQNGWQLQDKDLNPSKDEAYQAESILRLNRALQDDPDFDLSKVERLVPRIFFNGGTRKGYFSTGYSLVFLGEEKFVFDNTVYPEDITRLVNGLIIHSSKAAEQGDVKRAKKSLLLAVDVIALPLSLQPPEVVTLGPDDEGNTISEPGTAYYYNAIKPLQRFIKPLKAEIQKIKATSPSNELAMSSCESKPDDILEALRSEAPKIIELLKAHKADSKEYAEVFKAVIAKSSLELRALRECIDKAEVENVERKQAK